MAEAGSISGELRDEKDWVLHKDRVELKDITSVAQDDGPCPNVAISYSEKCEYIKPCHTNKIGAGAPAVRITGTLRMWKVLLIL
jgi:hypothetical protein